MFSDVRHHIKAQPSDIDMVPINEKKLIIIAKNESQSVLIYNLVTIYFRHMTIQFSCFCNCRYDDLLLELMDDIPTVSLDELKWNTPSPFPVKRVLALTVVGSIEKDFYINLNHTCATSHCSHLCRVPRDPKKRHECLCPLGFGLQAPRLGFSVWLKNIIYICSVSEIKIIISVELLVLNMPYAYIGNLNVTTAKNVYMQWRNVMDIVIAPMVVMNLRIGVAVLPLINGHVTTRKHQ